MNKYKERKRKRKRESEKANDTHHIQIIHRNTNVNDCNVRAFCNSIIHFVCWRTIYTTSFVMKTIYNSDFSFLMLLHFARIGEKCLCRLCRMFALPNELQLQAATQMHCKQQYSVYTNFM